MSKGIIYIMETALVGLVKIGRTSCEQYENRMRFLENNGYRNANGLKRRFAIEVENYENKEIMLHSIFTRIRIGDAELFALDVDSAIKLLSAFDGKIIYPPNTNKDDLFEEVVERTESKVIPNGIYKFVKKKKSDGNRKLNATAVINDGAWIIKANSIVGVSEDKGVSDKARMVRATMKIEKDTGKLLEDIDLGECSPSFAGTIVSNQSSDGWIEWKTIHKDKIDIYRQKTDEE